MLNTLIHILDAFKIKWKYHHQTDSIELGNNIMIHIERKREVYIYETEKYYETNCNLRRIIELLPK